MPPLFFGALHDVMVSWARPFDTLGPCLLVMLVGSAMINPKRCIEDSAAVAPAPPEQQLLGEG